MIPDPMTVHPMPAHQRVVFLAPLVTSPTISVGEYGNPAEPIRQRFDGADVQRLLRAAWWDWPVELVTTHVSTIMAGTPAEIEDIARAHRGDQ